MSTKPNHVLSREEILEQGINFDLLSYNSSMTLVLDDFEVCGGKPFTGLAYELSRTKQVVWYGWYENGLRTDCFVKFV